MKEFQINDEWQILTSIYAKDEDKALNYGEVFDLLNSQSAIIADLEKQNKELKKENERLKKKLINGDSDD